MAAGSRRNVEESDGKSEEFAEISLSCRFRKLLNNPYFLLQWANACAIDPVSQELEPSSTPDTLLGIDKYAVLVQPL